MGDAASPTLDWFANRYNALRIENTVGGVAIDVSTWTWRGQLRSSVDGVPVITMEVDDSDAANGVIELSVTAGAVADLADQVWSLGVDVIIEGQPSQVVKTNTVRFAEPVEP